VQAASKAEHSQSVLRLEQFSKCRATGKLRMRLGSTSQACEDQQGHLPITVSVPWHVP